MNPLFSLVTAYRNRDLPRAKRFLDSLQNQTFQDFELILVDYGSDKSYSVGASELCSDYPFCTYVFCDTRGKLWNRAHALNIGIQIARGNYFLSVDVDVIYSKDVLTRLSSSCNERTQFFCKAFLLPSSFTDYTSLLIDPHEFSLSSATTIGLFHCVQLNWVRQVNGYDEYYKIWGFEDTDLALRLEKLGLSAVWLDEQRYTIFHQWHPASMNHPFMQWWWQDMAIYIESVKSEVTQTRSWGELITHERRPLNLIRDTQEYTCPTGMNPFACRRSISHIMHLMNTNPHHQICVELFKEPERMYIRHNLFSRTIVIFATAINRCLRWFGSSMQLSVIDSDLHRSESSMLYFFYTIIMKSDILEDYRISEFGDKYRFTLLLRDK